MIDELLDRWHSEAELFRRRGQPHLADLAESYATDLSAAVREFRLATLTLAEAAAETGLKYDTIQKKVANGEVANVGRRGAPRVRRCDLLSDELLLARLGSAL